nr:hypothetical protein [Prevotella sp.]
MVDKAIVLHDILIPSICILYKEDFSNIRFDVSERNICARLAHHMENIMREYDAKNRTSFFTSYYADVEYNRMGNGDMKYYEDSLKRPKYMVSDLLIQSRGYEGNLLAVELKKKGATKEAIDNDIKRLKSLVTPGSLSQLTGCVHDTLLGAFIIYSKNGVNMDIFEFSSNEEKVIPRKYSLRCLFRDYDETMVEAMEICDGTQCRLIDLDKPFVPKLTFKDGEN